MNKLYFTRVVEKTRAQDREGGTEIAEYRDREIEKSKRELETLFYKDCSLDWEREWLWMVIWK